MNKFGILFFSSILILMQFAYGQDLTFKASMGYGFYNMKSLENFQNDISYTLPELNLKPVQSFPPFFNYQFMITKKFSSKINFGIFFEFLTTGGRNTISDYSGEINIDQIVNGYNFGLLFERNIFAGRIQNLFFTFRLSYIYSTIQVEENVKLYDKSSSISTDFSSEGLGIEPGFSYNVLTSPVIISTNLGFNVNLSKDFSLKENSNSKLQNIKAEWTGLRLGLSIGFCL